ncbi:hypothetical protein [Vibrio parahaemolyticus]|uniref:hypothetical protein n=1 Tax=Vibrio parahaemolyticus TaxID=670 RepID=UPI00046F6A0C|nr:hypothetical protein [Vibrio parahaemolyticus]QOW05753.1 threonyl-tRNA synthetase [Vibrio parahaemolyticus]
MDKVVFIPSAILGLIFISIYAYKCHVAKKKFSHQVMVNAVLQASGIVCGALLILSTFFEQLDQYLTNIDLYIFISGLAVLAVSVQSTFNDIFSIKGSKKASLESREETTAS